MLIHPRVGQSVRVRYRKQIAATRPYHGKIGVVAIASKGKPRNHGVLIDGRMVVVPCGNLVSLAGRVNREVGK